MKKVLLLAVHLLFASSSFCQWTTGYFRDMFGDKTNVKYLEFSTKNGSFNKEGKTAVGNSALSVIAKFYSSQDDKQILYGLRLELYENGGSKALNSTDFLLNDITLFCKIANGNVLEFPVRATEHALYVPIFKNDIKLINALLTEKSPIRCIVKVDALYKISNYNFVLDPKGFSDAFKLNFPNSVIDKETLLFCPPIDSNRVIEETHNIIDLDFHEVISEEKPVYGVEQMPRFPGGDEELLKFIHDNLLYPVVAAQVGIEGRVTIRFVVGKTGEVTDVTVIRGMDPQCDNEAVRIVKLMPKWIPGRQNGRNVPVYYTMPIVFKLQK